MTDVRLTATNPDDSSVVPVACNSKGELLVTEPKIEAINNDVTITGELEVLWEAEGADPNPGWKFFDNGDFKYEAAGQSIGWHSFSPSGTAQHRRSEEAGGKVVLAGASDALKVQNNSLSTTWRVGFDGTGTFSGLKIALEPNNPDNYVPSASKEADGEKGKEYKGPVLDVAEELEFLRAQVRALMEKLKMSPEGGWPVWDGSDS